MLKRIKNPANPRKLKSFWTISHLFPYISLKNYTYLESGAHDESNFYIEKSIFYILGSWLITP